MLLSFVPVAWADPVEDSTAYLLDAVDARLTRFSAGCPELAGDGLAAVARDLRAWVEDGGPPPASLSALPLYTPPGTELAPQPALEVLALEMDRRIATCETRRTVAAGGVEVWVRWAPGGGELHVLWAGSKRAVERAEVHVRELGGAELPLTERHSDWSEGRGSWIGAASVALPAGPPLEVEVWRDGLAPARVALTVERARVVSE